MRMNRHSFRIVPAAVAAALVFAACGADEIATDDPTETSNEQGDELRAPVPIEIASAGGGSGDRLGANAATEDATLGALDTMIAPAPWITEYVVGDGMPALPAEHTGFVFDAANEVTIEQVRQLADVFGVLGEPLRTDDGYSVVWRVGPDDGTAPSLWMSDDAQQSWNYNEAWSEAVAVEGCAVAVDSEGNETGNCPESEPPVGVPTSEQAEQRTQEMLTALGVDLKGVEFESFADQWSAAVNVSDTFDSRGSLRSWHFGFGADGILQYAGGTLATPQPVGPYPLVDLDTAVARLNAGSYWFGGPAVSGPGIAVEEVVSVDVAEADVAGTDAEPADPALVDPVPVDPVEPVPGSEPEIVVVTLVDVEADLWWAWDVDGSAWLLPAYRFIDVDGGWHTVPAVTDEFMIQVDPPDVIGDPLPLPEPMPVETTPTEAPDTTVANTSGASVVEVVEVVDDVQYYPGCSNEAVEIDGTTWYPVPEWGSDVTAALFGQIMAVTRQEPADQPQGFARRVAPPGPGDDVGTLVVYADGFARYESDSGTVIWLTTDVLTYDWVC